MPIVVEDGTGLATAQSYVSVADADAWHTDRGITTWTALLTAEKEQALVRATTHMVQVYRRSWQGYRRTAAQALDWPRTGVTRSDLYAGVSVADNIVPVEVRNACAELAFYAAAGNLNPPQGRSTRREKIGDLEVEYEPGASQTTRRPSIDAMLSGLLKSWAGNNSAAVVRV